MYVKTTFSHEDFLKSSLCSTQKVLQFQQKKIISASWRMLSLVWNSHSDSDTSGLILIRDFLMILKEVIMIIVPILKGVYYISTLYMLMIMLIASKKKEESKKVKIKLNNKFEMKDLGATKNTWHEDFKIGM